MVLTGFAILLGVSGHWLAVRWPSEGVFRDAKLEDHVLILSGNFIATDGSRQLERRILLDLDRGQAIWEVADQHQGKGNSGRKYAVRRATQAPGNPNQTQSFTVESLVESPAMASLVLESYATPLVIGDWLVSLAPEGLRAHALTKEGAPSALWNRSGNSRQIDLLATNRDNQFVLTDHSNGTIGSEVYRIQDGTVALVRAWPTAKSSMYFRLPEKDVYLIENQDGTRALESLQNDVFLSRNISSEIDTAAGMRFGINPAWHALIVADSSNRFRSFDLETLRILPTPSHVKLDALGRGLLARDHTRGLLFYGDESQIECVDETDGKTKWLYSTPQMRYRVEYMVRLLPEDRLLIHTQFPIPFACVVDRTTGAEQRVINPLWAIDMVLLLWLALAVLWVALWLAWSVQEGGWAWFDCGCILILAIGALVYRCLVSGIAEQADRIEYRMAMGLSAAGLAMTCFWFVFGRTRWTLRVIPIFVCLAVICGMTSIPFGIRSWAGVETLIGMIVALFWMFVLFCMARMRGLTLRQRSTNSDSALPLALESDTVIVEPQCSPPRSFPLRDIFVLTTVIALLFSFTRALPFPSMNFLVSELAFLNAAAILISINMLVTIQCALADWSPWARYSWILVAPTLGVIGTLGQSYWFEMNVAIGWYRFAPFHMTIACVSAVSTFGLMHAYRWRHWRIA